MATYIKYCRNCDRKFATELSYRARCADCTGSSLAMTLHRDVKKESHAYRDTSSSSSAVMPRNGAALAAGFLRQPRSSDVSAREVTYKNGEWKFREEYRRSY